MQLIYSNIVGPRAIPLQGSPPCLPLSDGSLSSFQAQMGWNSTRKPTSATLCASCISCGYRLKWSIIWVILHSLCWTHTQGESRSVGKGFPGHWGSLVNQTAGWQQQGSSNSRSLVTRVGLGRAASSLLSLWQHCSSKKTSCQHLGIFVVREHCNVLPQTERADARLAFRKQLTLIKWCDFPWSWHSGSILGKQKACGDDSLVFACGLSNFFSFWLFFHVFFFFFLNSTSCFLFCHLLQEKAVPSF